LTRWATVSLSKGTMFRAANYMLLIREIRAIKLFPIPCDGIAAEKWCTSPWQNFLSEIRTFTERSRSVSCRVINNFSEIILQQSSVCHKQSGNCYIEWKMNQDFDSHFKGTKIHVFACVKRLRVACVTSSVHTTARQQGSKRVSWCSVSSQCAADDNGKFGASNRVKQNGRDECFRSTRVPQDVRAVHKMGVT
jgi:hypothetical protein